jgi:hypothetical protein
MVQIKMTNADNILFRCSSLGYLMTEPRSKSETLSETTKTHLVDVYVSKKYNRFTELNSKFLDKGNEVEEDSITTVSRITKDFFTKNVTSLKNEFIQGTPDLFKGESIKNADVIRDCKSSWDIYTFNRAIAKALDPKYKWQGTGYMALTGATVCFIDYCLNNTPFHLVDRELRMESYKHESGDVPTWIKLQIIANHVYDKKTFDEYLTRLGIEATDENSKAVVNDFVEVPFAERHYSFEFDRSDADIEKMYARIRECRAFMNENIFNAPILVIK